MWGKLQTILANIILQHTLGVDGERFVRVDGNQHVADVCLWSFWLGELAISRAK